jgi:hypothetical protein
MYGSRIVSGQLVEQGSKCPLYLTADPQDPTELIATNVACITTSPCPMTTKTTNHKQTVTVCMPEEQSPEAPGSLKDPFPSPIPKCTVDDAHCAGYWSRYRAERIRSGLEDFDFLRPGDGGMPCGIVEGHEGSHDCCGMEGGRELVLIYWPPYVDGRNVCAADGQGTTVTRDYHNVKSPLVVTIPAITFRGLGIEEFTFIHITTESGSAKEYSGESMPSSYP